MLILCSRFNKIIMKCEQRGNINMPLLILHLPGDKPCNNYIFRNVINDHFNLVIQPNNELLICKYVIKMWRGIHAKVEKCKRSKDRGSMCCVDVFLTVYNKRGFSVITCTQYSTSCLVVAVTGSSLQSFHHLTTLVTFVILYNTSH